MSRLMYKIITLTGDPTPLYLHLKSINKKYFRFVVNTLEDFVLEKKTITTDQNPYFGFKCTISVLT